MNKTLKQNYAKCKNENFSKKMKQKFIISKFLNSLSDGLKNNSNLMTNIKNYINFGYHHISLHLFYDLDIYSYC